MWVWGGGELVGVREGLEGACGELGAGGGRSGGGGCLSGSGCG